MLPFGAVQMGQIKTSKWAKLEHRTQHQGKSKDEISDVLTGTYKWPKGGLAIAQVDAFIEEMKSWQ